MSIEELEAKLKPGARAHLVGIGGVSMSPLAEVLYAGGIAVSGSDAKESAATERLRELGIPVTIGHFAKSVRGSDLVIRTAAVRDDNEEIAEAKALGIPVFERAEAWGHIMRSYRDAICIAGSHGKTTTTSMVAQILLAANVDPTVMIGGTLPSIGSGYRVGHGRAIVLEACEYYDSFLKFFPTVAVVLNVDDDHLDYFGTFERVKASFAAFANLAPPEGTIVCNADDADTMDALRPLGRELLTFGFDAGADVRGEHERPEGQGVSLDVLYEDRVYCRLKLRVPGHHNVMNALASAAVAIALGLPGEAVEDGLRDFMGAGRRFEFKGKINGADIFDDYAHHPSELKALLDMTLALPYERVLLAFQPHTYSRTATHFDAFAEQLKRPAATFLAEIYAAREKNTYNVTSADLARAIPGAVHCATFAELTDKLAAEARPGDLILTVGAGELDTVGAELARRGEEANTPDAPV
ncbi:MAG: UDP-N-acetylmuramate--L-alanine ligase [Oscillospiraceae bacterium]|jgi:UDP-N-acetylmuramate--alanine ligase|nr:UDP-N-acetylmuramate--L-alanine ligase [Oscillospiraceae bacterium]